MEDEIDWQRVPEDRVRLAAMLSEPGARAFLGAQAPAEVALLLRPNEELKWAPILENCGRVAYVVASLGLIEHFLDFQDLLVEALKGQDDWSATALSHGLSLGRATLEPVQGWIRAAEPSAKIPSVDFKPVPSIFPHDAVATHLANYTTVCCHALARYVAHHTPWMASSALVSSFQLFGGGRVLAETVAPEALRPALYGFAQGVPVPWPPSEEDRGRTLQQAARRAALRWCRATTGVSA